MEISAGLLIIQDNKILLAHPTSAPWYGTYTIPKGKVQKNETLIDAAMRETFEEVHVKIDINDIENIDNPNIIEYINEKGVVYKKLFYFVVHPKTNIKINKKKLGIKEVDWAGFIDKNESMDRIFWRFDEMLKLID